MIKNLFSERSLNSISAIFWGLVLFTLPITSFRHYPAIFGNPLRQPLAFIPLGFFFIAIIFSIWRRKKVELPPQTTQLVLFLIAVAIATIIGILYSPTIVRNTQYLSRGIRAWVSFGIGLGFFVAAIFAARSELGLKKMLNWLYAGFILSFIWGIVQLLAYNTSFVGLPFVNSIRELYTFPAVIYNRIYGFAFEPSWFADQITILYLPWLLASVLTGYKLGFNKWITWLFILGSGILLIFSFSRHGILGAVVATPIVVLVTGRKQVKIAWNWFWDAVKSKKGNLKSWLLRFAVVALILIIFVGSAYFLNRSDYFSTLWQVSLDEGLVQYVIKNNAGPRLAYLDAGLGIFDRYPITGVGLGGAGLYMFEEFPDWSLSGLPEMDRFLSPDSNLIPNIKNLYVRLLAETGLVGFWFYIAFYFSILASIWKLIRSKLVFPRFVGTAGLFIWITIAMRNFTQDSLTFPVMWVSLGLVVGFAHRYNSGLLDLEGESFE